MAALGRFKKSLDAVVAITDGAVIDTLAAEHLTMVCIASGGGVNATVLLQGSVDGSTWYTIATRNLAAAGATADSTSDAHRYVRARCSAWVSGTITAWLLTTGHIPGGWDTS